MKPRNLPIWTLTAALFVTLALGCNKNQNASAREDTQVAADVQSKINSDSNVPNKAITVNSNKGIVTLAGTVGSEMERQAASNDAATVDGVKTVVNNLEVGQQSADNAAMPGTNQPSTSTTASDSGSRATTTKGNRIHTAPLRRTPLSSTTPSNMASNAAPSTSSAPVVPQQVTIPAGTSLSIRTIDPVDSEKAQVGQVFSATLDSPVEVDGRIVIPANADVQGKVVDVKSAGKFQGASLLTLDLTKVSFNGKSYSINTDQWSKTGTSRGKNTAAKVGGGAALGAIIGAIAGGGKGAAIGAGVGAGVGTGAQAVTHGQQIVVQPETLLAFTLRSPVTVTPSSTSRNPNRTRLGAGDNQ
ncbi:MAG: transport-associated protein [Acidobacteriaceae bacterium]|nr:transport-associated protein [Acidobacteriaceae bacterium]